MSEKLNKNEAAEYIEGALGINAEQINIVTELNEQEYEDEQPDSDPTYVLGLKAVIHNMPQGVTVDPAITKKQDQLEAADKGIQSVEFMGWGVKLNWSPTARQHLPPYHMVIEYHGTQVAILSPFLMARTCYKCGHRGWNSQAAKQGLKIGRCVPGHPCPRCRSIDWWGKVAQPNQFERDAAEFLATDTGRDELFDRYAPDKFKR